MLSRDLIRSGVRARIMTISSSEPITGTIVSADVNGVITHVGDVMVFTPYSAIETLEVPAVPTLPRV